MQMAKEKIIIFDTTLRDGEQAHRFPARCVTRRDGLGAGRCGAALGGPAGRDPEGREEVRPPGPCPNGSAVPGVRRDHSGSVFRGQVFSVLSGLSDRWQGTGRPADVAVTQMMGSLT